MHTRPTMFAGMGLALACVCAVVFGAALGLDLDQAVLVSGVLGAVLGLMPGEEPRWQLAGFGVGATAAWLGYGVRASLLPDSSAGVALAAAGVIVLCLLVAIASGDRIPLWAALLGVAALAGTVEHTFDPAAAQFVPASLSAVTTAALAAALGYLATVVAGGRFERPDPGPAHRASPAPSWDDILDRYGYKET